MLCWPLFCKNKQQKTQTQEGESDCNCLEPEVTCISFDSVSGTLGFLPFLSAPFLPGVSSLTVQSAAGFLMAHFSIFR